MTGVVNQQWKSVVTKRTSKTGKESLKRGGHCCLCRSADVV